jgi:hypothetical protein
VEDLYVGATIVVRLDPAQRAIVILARNGKAPPLTLPVRAIVSATANGQKLELVGQFDNDTKIALRLASVQDAMAIAHALAMRLNLPRIGDPVALGDLDRVPDGAYIAIEGRCMQYAVELRMEDRIVLRGISGRIDQLAPYRATGFLRRGGAELELQVFELEHLNPPVTWLEGETVRVVFAPQTGLVGFVQQPGHTFTEPGGTFELHLPVQTMAYVAVDGQHLVFEGDFSRTNYPNLVKLGPVGAGDTRAIFLLLDEKLQLPRAPKQMTPAQAAALAEIDFVCVDGEFRMGHIEGPNFDAGIQVADRDQFQIGRRYRVTGFLYPRNPGFTGIGYSGPRIKPLSVELLQ